MSIVQLFQGKEVRFVGTWEKPEWVAADVVAILYPDVKPKDRIAYLATVPEKWTDLRSIKIRSKNGIEQTRKVKTLLEPGLNRLVARSDSPIAIPFQDWLFEEVLPSIRKTGSYSIAPQPKLDLLALDEQTLDRLDAWMYYRTLPSLEAQWEAFQNPDCSMEGWCSPAEAIELDERLKTISNAAYDYLRGHWYLKNEWYQDAKNPNWRSDTYKKFVEPNHAAFREFQAQIDRAVLDGNDRQRVKAIG